MAGEIERFSIGCRSVVDGFLLVSLQCFCFKTQHIFEATTLKSAQFVKEGML